MTFIEGVNLLNIETQYGINYAWFFIPLVFAILGVITIVIFEKTELGLVSWLFCWIVFIILAVCSCKIPCGEYYEVTIDNNVSMSEFTNHYNIISQRGNIYTIEFKETENE